MNNLLHPKSVPSSVLTALAASMFALTGCGENIFEVKWREANVDTVLVYSLARPELNLPTAFDFVARRALEVEDPQATGVWDLLLDTQAGELVFLPPGALDVGSGAMVLKLPDMAFDDVIKAPKDTTLYSKNTPLSVETSSVYVFRTHQGSNRFGFPCFFFGKLQPLEVQPAVGTVRFMYDVSTLCDDRHLIPPD